MIQHYIDKNFCSKCQAKLPGANSYLEERLSVITHYKVHKNADILNIVNQAREIVDIRYESAVFLQEEIEKLRRYLSILDITLDNIHELQNILD